MKKTNWKEIQEWQHNNKGLLSIVADPKSDEILISFGELNTFVRFPMESYDKGVVFNMLRKSKFEKAIEPFIASLVESMGVSELDKPTNEFLKVVGGSIKALGVGNSKGSKLEVINKKAK